MPGSYCVVMLKRGDRMIPASAPRVSAVLVESLGDFSFDSVVTACTTAFAEGRDHPLRRHRQPACRGALSGGGAAARHPILVVRPGFLQRGARGWPDCRTTGPRLRDPARNMPTCSSWPANSISVCIEQRELNDQLAYRAQHDALTGLLNRAQLRGTAQACHRCTPLGTTGGWPCCPWIWTASNSINDTLGHAAGDEVLKQLAGRLVESLRETDVVARWGGDEFVIGLMEIGDPSGRRGGRGEVSWTRSELHSTFRGV